MSPKDALVELLSLLERERQAIREMDAKRVEELAERKEVLCRIAVTPEMMREDGAPGMLRELAFQLRRNGVLLAHARACLQDALPIAHSVAAGSERGRPAPTLVPRAGVLVSLRG